MTKRPYQLSASEIAARSKSMRRLTDAYLQPSFQICLNAIHIADDNEGVDVAHGQNVPWSTGKKKGLKVNYEDSSVLDWPSQALKAMTTFSHGNGLSESCNTGDRIAEFHSNYLGDSSGESTKTDQIRTLKTSRRSVRRMMSAHTNPEESESCKKLAEFDAFAGWSQTSRASKHETNTSTQTNEMRLQSPADSATVEADRKERSQSKASYYRADNMMKKLSFTHSIAPEPTCSKLTELEFEAFNGWSKTFRVQNTENDGITMTVDSDSSMSSTGSRLHGRRHPTSKVPRNKKIQARKREQDTFANLAEFDAYKVWFPSSET